MGINDSTQNDLTSYYDSFLRAKQDNHKKKYEDFKGWFSASTAGSCFRKQYYNINGYEGSEPDETSMRLLRLGTIVHKDIADAMEYYREDIQSRGLQLFVEHKVILEDLNVVGHLDLGIYDEEQDILYITDIKTAHSHKWQRTFGRKYGKSPSENYYLQLATYGLGLIKELGHEPETVELSLTWYKKDDSEVRAQKIDNLWMDEAKRYWENLTEILEDFGPEGPPINWQVYNNSVVPVQRWECKYCPFHNVYCKGI